MSNYRGNKKDYNKAYKGSKNEKWMKYTTDTENNSVEEDFKVMDERRKFKRPMLNGVTTAEVCTFYARVKSYLVQVSAAQLSSGKLREAKNLVYCISPVVLRYLVDYGFKNQRIKSEEGQEITHSEQITSDLFFLWVKRKAVRTDGPDLESRKQDFIEKLMENGKFRFTYVEGAGTMKEQLMFHDSKLSLHYEENGMEEVMTDQNKIAVYIRLLSPWALARCTILAVTQPGRDYLDSITGDAADRLRTDYAYFKKEVIQCIVTEIAAGIQYNTDMLRSLKSKELTTAEQLQVGSLFKEALNARKAKKTEYRLKTLEDKVLNKLNNKPDYRNKTDNSKGFEPIRRTKVAVVSDRGDDTDNTDNMEGESSSIGDSSSISDGDAFMTRSDGMESSDDESGCYTDDDIRFNAVKMAFIRGNEKRGYACSNCGKTGCFSATCKEPCKFCTKTGCKSWTCIKRPEGYGKGATNNYKRKNTDSWKDTNKIKKVKKVKRVKVRKVNARHVNQVSATICGTYETSKVLLDTGADRCCITMALLKEIESRIGYRIRTKRSENPVNVEFANGEKVKCCYYANLPIVEFRQKHGGIIVKENLNCLVIPGDLMELIVGQDLLEREWGINVVQLFNDLPSNMSMK
jgi:hypothetical protein